MFDVVSVRDSKGFAEEYHEGTFDSLKDAINKADLLVGRLTTQELLTNYVEIRSNYNDFGYDVLYGADRRLVIGNRSFQIVDEVPPGYKVWGISVEHVNGFLPLFKDSDVPYQIDRDSLKAIYVGSTSVINTLMGIGRASAIRNSERALSILNDPNSSQSKRKFALKFLSVAKEVPGL